MNADDERIDALAASVGDGRPVDWEGAAPDATGEGARALHELSRIAQFNRDLQRSASPQEAPPSTWGDLLLLERVGAGATGEVWRAWDPRLQREVALKFLQAGGAQAGTPADSPLVEEARALARVRHEGVVAVHGIGESDGRVAMAMEFLRGATLAAEIERRGALPAREVARIGCELCRALEAVHTAGLLHCDLKPANVVLEPGGRAVLTDFGLGQRRMTLDPARQRISGTPMFMAPERLRGEPSTPRSDLYALGVTLRFALTGLAPFAARSLDELRIEADGGPAIPLRVAAPQAPAALVSAIERAMAPDAARRFASASEMEAALRSAAADPEAAAKASPPRRGRALAVAAIALVLAGAAWLALRGQAKHVVPPAAQAPPPAPSAARYDVQATLVRRSGGAYERLADGDRTRPGDRLSLEFRATRPMWVYVLNEDERGESYLLFPQPLFDRGNPIPPGTATVLPGPVGGSENAWTVTSRGGREHFIVVASPEPVAAIESELRELPAPKPGRPIEYAAIGRATIERLRGVGGVSPLPQGTTAARSDAFERFEALAGREAGVRGVWVRRVTLENPLR